jgi:transposase
MNDNDFYPYAYCEVGKRYYESRPGHHKKRISMIGGLCKETFLAPFMFEGYCDTSIFELYIEEILVPVLMPGKIIVIDNASFHQSERIRDLIEKAGCQLIYLPPYSPDLNPIEHYWHKIKNAIRKLMRDVKITLEDAMESTLKHLSIV